MPVRVWCIGRSVGHDRRMPAERVPLLHHDWLGPLFRYGEDALIGELSIDAAVRPPRMNGQTDAEVLLEFGPVDRGPDLDARLATVTTRIKLALGNLAEIRAYGVEHGPSEWRDHFEPLGDQPLAERLFLDGFEVNQALDINACFDYEDLGTLVVHIDPAGRGRAVELHL
jgi:hypothetical protein